MYNTLGCLFYRLSTGLLTPLPWLCYILTRPFFAFLRLFSPIVLQYNDLYAFWSFTTAKGKLTMP